MYNAMKYMKTKAGTCKEKHKSLRLQMSLHFTL